MLLFSLPCPLICLDSNFKLASLFPGSGVIGLEWLQKPFFCWGLRDGKVTSQTLQSCFDDSQGSVAESLSSQLPCNIVEIQNSATLIDWHRFGRSVSQSLPIRLHHGKRALRSFLFLQIWMIYDIDHWQLQMHGASYVEKSRNTWNDWMPHEKMMASRRPVQSCGHGERHSFKRNR